jgi:bacillithiol biosynthesis cysteine-adding enzyme BshC
MKNDTVRSSFPIIENRAIEIRGSLTERILSGSGPVALPLVRDCEFERNHPPSELSVDAFGTSNQKVSNKLAQILDGSGFLVTTGHQPILFLGPMYVLYKVLTTIALAEELEKSTEIPVIPVVWLASDDHDWREVGSTSLLDHGELVQNISIQPPRGYEKRSAGSCFLENSIFDAVDRIGECIGVQSFNDDYLTFIRDSYQPGLTLTEAFADLLLKVLGTRDYAWIDSGAPQVKKAAAGLYTRILEDPTATLAATDQGVSALSSAGFEPPITPMAGALPIFYDDGSRRMRLYLKGDTITPGRTESRAEEQTTWQERLAERPEAFSPNVSSRPVLESYLLPVRATVLGPGEIAYWSQLPPLFDYLKVPCPAIHPRAGWTLLEPKIQRLLNRLRIEPHDVRDGGEKTSASLTRQAHSKPIDETLDELQSTLTLRLDKLETVVKTEIPGLKSAAGKMRKQLFDVISEFSQNVNREARRRLASELGQVQRCAINLHPKRTPQERVMSPFLYLSKYGPELIETLAERTAQWVAVWLADADEDG